ncbi:MAG: hypothetical protein U9R60_15050 [Bacteroidota bacterium]|nr:hypothetical protein [Bacteroidota bacterium]
MGENFDKLLQKLDKFTRKYYLNQLLKGGLYFIGIFVVFYLFVTILEYYAYFNPLTRTIVFYTYLGINLVILWSLILIPLLKLFSITRTISKEQAASIIGKHFPEVSDKLLNTLQLHDSIQDQASISLAEASIDQKTQELTPVPFLKVIDLRKNRKYLKYAAPPLLILLLILLISPNIVTEPSYRIVHHDRHFEKARPYEIIIATQPLEAVQQEDFQLEVKVAGEQVPSQLYIEFNEARFRLSRESNVKFHYVFMNLQQDVDFRIMSDDFSTQLYTLRVLPKPIILNFDTRLDYPAYTGKKDETLDNTGDLIIPEGTEVEWKFYTRDARGISINFKNYSNLLDLSTSNTSTHKARFLGSESYSVSVFNEYLKNPDSLVYSIIVIPDLYPGIFAEEYMDSAYLKHLYFKGLIKDDYGFNALTFNYVYLNNFDSVKLEDLVFTEKIPISLASNHQQYYHHLNLDKLNISPGDELEYYFEVWDNDAVNGSKMTRSQKMFFRAPTLKEIEEETEASNNAIKDELEQSIQDAKLLQKQINKMHEKMVNKESLNWEDRQQLQDLINQQLQLQDNIDRFKQENLQKSHKEQQYKELNEEVFEKQKQLEDLFEQIMDEEMKKLFEEIREMLDEINKDKVNDMLEKMDMNADELTKELDRSLELFKQLEFDKKLGETIEKISELAEEQLKLAEKTQDKKQETEDLSEKQEEINEAFEDIRNDLDDLEKKNDELEDPNQLMDTEDSEAEIQEELDNSLNSLNEKQRKKANQSQNNAGQKLQDLSEQLLSMQLSMNQQSLAEDVRVLREILENLIQLSFDQEDLMLDVGNTNVNDPSYPELIREQKRIKDDMVVVQDSLYALSKRQISIQPFVNKEIEAINRNIRTSVQLLNDRNRKAAATGKQQFVMTSMNNLALLLSEALQQMQQNLNMDSNANCSGTGNPKPGSGKPGKMNMSEMQKQLNKQLQNMKKGMQEGGKQPNKTGQGGMSEELARLAAQQEAIRRQMESYLEQLKEEGIAGDAGINKLMQDMDKTETDLVNKRISNETLKRQQDILTRLLKHEEAAREREKEERRESTESKNQNFSNPEEFFEYKRLMSKEAELLKTIPPQLKTFYKNKVTEYFYNFMH